MTDEHASEIADLRKRFGKNEVLRGVDLGVETGSIFGFLGRNGAGKTTTILAMLGLLKTDGGRCRVLGHEASAEGVVIRRKVGYMAENQRMYDWMTVRQTIDWVGSFYPRWDDETATELRDRFGLDEGAKVGALSKGQTSKLALLLALAHRPELVVLDDPTLGLDPIARKDFLREVIGQLQARGVTVLFSSHLLYEIEPICDHVGILEGGRIVRTCATEALREQVKRVVVPVPDEGRAVQVPGLLDVEIEGRSAALVTEDVAGTRAAVAKVCGNHLEVQDLNLDEIFEAYVIGRRVEGPFSSQAVMEGAAVGEANVGGAGR